MKQIDISISGMSCAACVNRVESVISKDPSVIAVSVSLATNRAMLIVNDSINIDTIFSLIKNAGFTPSLDEIVDHRREKMLMRKFKLTLPLTIIVFFVAMIPMITGIEIIFSKYIQLILSAIVLIYGGSPFYIPVIKNPLSLNMNSLVTLGTFTAFTYSLVLLIMGASAHELYFESSSIIITFLLLGRALEDRAKRDVAASINSLINLSPKYATTIVDGKEEKKPISDISIDDIIILKVGDIIPTDGKIIDGDITVDESMLTGESKPIKKGLDLPIYTGTVVLNGSARYISLKLGKDTVLASITKAVLDASMHKASIERLADKIASVFVPIVLVIAAITLSIWLVITGSLALAIVPFVSILVIACPCALGLATPTAIMATVGRAAKEGILIKNGEVLERIKDLDIIIFDKTGTLTDGNFSLLEFITYNNFDRKELLGIIHSVENRSEHLVARSIVKYAESSELSSNISSINVDMYENIAGEGVKASVNDKTILIGNDKLMNSNNISIIDDNNEVDDTIVYIAVDNIIAGKMILGDKLRDNTEKLIYDLQTIDIEPIIVSGDTLSAVRKVAMVLGIEKYYYATSPHSKVEIIENIQSSGKKVAMVGDGINDAIALSRADIGLSLSSSTDIAISSSDVTIVSNNIYKLLFTIRLSKKSSIIIRENLFWAFIYNIIAIPIAAGVLYPVAGVMLNPAIAGIAMAFSSVTVLFNSLRLKRFN